MHCALLQGMGLQQLEAAIQQHSVALAAVCVVLCHLCTFGAAGIMKVNASDKLMLIQVARLFLMRTG
jgi:hypothetical protein